MRQKTHEIILRLMSILALAAVFCLFGPTPASAQDLSQSFQLSYDPVKFDKSEIKSGEVFHATIAGRATCTKDLPVSIGEASLTSQVVAVHAVSGATVTLNTGYTVTIKPFPSKQGQTAEISQTVPLQFPSQAAPGDYRVIGKISEAKVKIGFISMDVSGYLPQEEPMGSVKYAASASAPAPATTPSPLPQNPPTAEPKPGPPPVASYPAGNGIPIPQKVMMPPEPEQIIPWWVWLIVAVAGATIAFNLTWFLSRRY